MPALVADPKAIDDLPPLYSKEHLASLGSHLDLVNALAHLESVEFQVDESLSKFLSSPTRLEAPLGKIGDLRPIVSGLTRDALNLHEVVVERAAVAERISSKVRVLDLEQSRVKDCIDRVLSAIELKDALGQLFHAIDRADWEAATRHVQRANAIDQDFITSRFAEAVVPTADIPDPPSIALHNFTNQLIEIFLRSFEAAARSKDEATTTRFFKLFPLLGPEASTVGLKAYSDFVQTLISVPASLTRPAEGQRNTSIASQITSVFEQLALIIDQHQGMVDKYYGRGSMVVVVIRLNEEMDRLMLKHLISWQSDRQLDRTLASVASCPFTWLTQTLNGPIGNSATNLMNSPAALQSSLRSLAGNVQRSYNLQPSVLSIQDHTGSTPVEGETEDPREVDLVVADLAIMSTRWQTYRRFIYCRFIEEDSTEIKSDDQGPPTGRSTDSAHRQSQSIQVTKLSQSIHSLLDEAYLPLETWYLRVNIEKAHISDMMELTSLPYLSSALDDTFFILKKVLMRLISIGEVVCVENGLRQFKDILERDFGEVMKRRLEAVGGQMGTGAAFGLASKMGEEKERRERNIRNSYVVYLNNLSMASDYIVRLVEEVISGPALPRAFFIASEVELIRSSLENLKRVESKFTGIAKSGLEQLFNQLIRPRMRSILSDCYKDVSYILDDESYAEAEYQDLFRKRFCKAWEGLIEPFREALTPKNFHGFFGMTVNVIVRPWESMIRNMKFNELGAMRFDRDLRLVTSYLSNQTDFGISLINESFARLRQISMLLGLNEVEEDLKDFLVSEEVAWRLTMSEIKGVLGQKI